MPRPQIFRPRREDAVWEDSLNVSTQNTKAQQRPAPAPNSRRRLGRLPLRPRVGRSTSCPPQQGPPGPAPNLSLKLPHQASPTSSYLFQSPACWLLLSTPAARGQGSSPSSPLSCSVTSASALPSPSSRFLRPVSGVNWNLRMSLGTDVMTASWLSVCPRRCLAQGLSRGLLRHSLWAADQGGC